MEDKAKENYLEYIPVIVAEYETGDDGSITVLQENKGIMKWLTQKLIKKPRVSKIHLDKMGNFIWPLMNGENSILDIANAVKEQFGDEAEPLYDRLVKYIKTLESYGFISIR